MLQHSILCKIFNSYCCSMYGSQIWKFNTNVFNQFCIYWNKAVCRLFHLPYCTHTWLLGPMMNQLHIRDQMYIRGLKFLDQMMNCKNLIVNMCMQNASKNANSPIGYKFAFYRNVCAIRMN